MLHGVYLVWLVQERGFSPALVATVLAAGDLCVFALEIPTGWMADRLGHRRSLIIGSLVQVLGMIAFWRAASTPGLLLAALLVGAGDAFRSGADEALLYRTCVALGREPDFQTIEARTRSVSLIALVALLLAGGGLVALIGYDAAFMAEITMCAIGLALACLLVEPPAAASPDGDDRPAPAARRVEGSRWRLFMWLVLPGALIDGMAGIAAFLAQTGACAEVAGVTMIVAAMTLSEAAGAWTAARVGSNREARVWRNDGRLHLLLLACGVAVFAASLMTPAGAAAAAVVLAFLPGLIHPLRAVALQRVAGDGVRARIASFASACDMACTTLGLLAAGAVSARRRQR